MEEVYRLRFESIAAGGAAVARLEGKAVFVEGGAPGETACCRITEDRASWARAELLEIIEPSPVRTAALCPLYGVCGGCKLQHIDYGAQLVAKTAILTESFRRIGGLLPPEPEVFPSPPWEYRNRFRFHRASAGGCPSFGLKGPGGVVALGDCPVAEPGIRSLLRGGGAEIRPPPGRDQFTVYSKDGLLLSEGGKERGKITLLDRDVLVDAGVFFQSNAVMQEKLIEAVRDAADGADFRLPMADLYAGVGTFAVFCGGLFAGTVLMEENKKALAAARENLNGSPADFSACRGAEWAREARKSGARYGFIVADPPRGGLAPRLAAWLAEAGPPLLAYVSCDPASLARDAALLAGGGYAVKSLALFDFYPQTAHLESLAVFER